MLRVKGPCRHLEFLGLTYQLDLGRRMVLTPKRTLCRLVSRAFPAQPEMVSRSSQDNQGVVIAFSKNQGVVAKTVLI